MFFNSSLKTAFFTILIVSLICFKSYAADKIIAVVNDELITQSDLSEYVNSSYAGLASRGYDESDLEKIRLDLDINAIHRIIEDKLILSRANETGIIVNDRLVKERIDEIKARYPNEETFMAALSKAGVSITDLRTKILDQLKIQYIITHEVRSKIFVNPQEVTNYYNDHLGQYMKNERIVLDSIYIKFDKDKEAARQKAQEVVQKINDGGNFNDLMKEYSHSSSIGTVERGQLISDIENVVFSLTKDEISVPVEVDTGVYIFKLKDKFSKEKVGLEEVKDKIYNLLFSQKFEKNFNKWIEGLKKNAYIEIK